MAESTEVIQHQMEETRLRLADNLEKLTHQTTGAVAEVASTVTDTVGAVQETVATVTDTVQQTVEGAKQALDLSAHVERYPWLMMGGSVAVGYVAGCLLTPPSSPEQPSPSSASGTGSQGQMDMNALASSSDGGAYRRGAQPSSSQGPDWFSGLARAFAPTIDKLKGLAIGTAFGMAREVFTKGLSQQFSSQIRDVIDDVTVRLGGKVLPQEGRSSSDHSSGGTSHASGPASQRGDDHEHSHTTKMDRPVGTSQRKG